MKVYIELPAATCHKNSSIQNIITQKVQAILCKSFREQCIIEYTLSEDEKYQVCLCVTPPKNSNLIRTEIKESLKSLGISEGFVNVSFNIDYIPRKSASETDKKIDKEFDYERLSKNYISEEPRFSFEQVVLSDKLKTRIEEAVGIIQVESKVFDEWGLRSIIPDATSAISFYGPPGTGKTMAAEAIARKLGKKILKATYADIESKYHGEGPKMVKAIFRAAEHDDAVLFLDESDSLLSKRLTNVSDGSGQAINSMRSQLLICLEQFHGIVIFATNLAINYDKAFLSRLINIEFMLPSSKEREKIWHNHLMADGLKIPLSYDVNIKVLADTFDFCGREIKNAVKDACVSVALKNQNQVTQADLIKACEEIAKEKERVCSTTDHTVSMKIT